MALRWPRRGIHHGRTTRPTRLGPHPTTPEQVQAVPGLLGVAADDHRPAHALTTFSTRALAEKWLADERRLIENGEWSPPRDRIHREVIRAQTFGDNATRWLEQHPMAESSRKNCTRYYRNHMADALGGSRCAPWMHRRCAPGSPHWTPASTGSGTPNTKVLKNICNTAFTDGALTANP